MCSMPEVKSFFAVVLSVTHAIEMHGVSAIPNLTSQAFSKVRLCGNVSNFAAKHEVKHNVLFRRCDVW